MTQHQRDHVHTRREEDKERMAKAKGVMESLLGLYYLTGKDPFIAQWELSRALGYTETTGLLVNDIMKMDPRCQFIRGEARADGEDDRMSKRRGRWSREYEWRKKHPPLYLAKAN